MINTRTIDDLFDSGSCQNYILSIQCSLNGFSFLIFDTISGKFIVHIDHEIVLASPFELKKELEYRFKTEAVLNQHFKRVVVSYLSLRSVLIPDFIDIEDSKRLVIETAYEKAPDEIILENNVDSGAAKLLFTVPNVLYHLLDDKFSDCHFFAPPLPLVKYGLSKNCLSPTLFIERNADLMHLLLIHEKKIHFLNQFYVRNDTDCLYYILNAATQLKLEPKTRLHLLGKINSRSVLVNMLRNYFEKVEFAPADKRCAAALGPLVGWEHYLIPQIELTLCE